MQCRDVRWNSCAVALVLGFFIAAQLLIGTRLPTSREWTFSTAIDEDILYYAAIAKQIAIGIPPENPVFAGVHLYQSWLPMVPVAWLMPFFGPFLAMRVLNVAYVAIIAYLFRIYRPGYWGLLALLAFATQTLKYEVHSIGLDAIFKGFYHLPALIAFIVVLFEKQRQPLRFLSLALLPWLHAPTAIVVFAFLLGRLMAYRDKQSTIDLFICGTGMLLYRSLFSNPDATPAYDLLLGGFFLNPLEPTLRILVWMPFIRYCRDKILWVFFLTTFLLSSLLHWEPFAQLYMLDFCAALMVVDGLPRAPVNVRRLFLPVTSVAVILFVLYGSVIKFSRDTIMDTTPLMNAVGWVEANTASNAVFAIAPTLAAEEPKTGASRYMPIIIAIRAVYYGPKYMIESVGLDPEEERYRRNLSIFATGDVPPEVDFVFYGPSERARFPTFSGLGRKVYDDPHVTIYDVRASKPRHG